MPTELRKTGISVVGDRPWGTHFCHFYETQDDLFDILLPYFKTGLENNEFCLWVIAEPLTEEEARSALRQAVPGLERYLAEGSIEILSDDEWFLKGDAFDLHRVITRLSEKLEQALARGYSGIRVSGSSAWLQKKDWREFGEFEKGLDELIANQRMLVSCVFPLATSGAAEILDAARTHQFTVARRHRDWEVVETPELKQAKAEITRLNEGLEQRVVERTSELAAINEELRGEITARQQAEEQLKRSNEELRALSARLQSVREEESIRIARAIHDDLGGALTGLKMDLSWLGKRLPESGTEAARQKLDSMSEFIDETMQKVRNISTELRPSVLDDLGLSAAIVWQAREFQQRTEIECKITSLQEEIALRPETATAVFRILQEILTNVARHANASLIEISLEEHGSSLVLKVSDNGVGISDSNVSDTKSLGLIGMRERAVVFGGRVDITGAEGNGTTVTVSIPRE